MPENDAPPYTVGYGKPPRVTRFQPGQSGNPKGRPKGSKNFATAIQEELDTRIAVTENGRRKTISKRQAIAKQLVNKAAAGDPRALPILFNEARIQESRAHPEIAEEVGPEDAMVMARIAQRFREAALRPPALDDDHVTTPPRAATDDENTEGDQ